MKPNTPFFHLLCLQSPTLLAAFGGGGSSSDSKTPAPTQILPAAEAPAPAPTPVLHVERFTPKQACTCQLIWRECDPPSKCLCQFSGIHAENCSCDSGSNPNGIAYVCNSFDCCEGQTRRLKEGIREEGQHLMGADFAYDPNDPIHQELYKSYLEECGEHEYDIWLYVTHHMYAVASPNDSNCPFLVTHAMFEDPTSAATKKLLFWETKVEAEARFAKKQDWKDKSYLVGQFTLKDLARAYEQVDPADEGPYDVITNNCAHYILRLAKEIGITVDAQITSFVVRRLTEESSGQMMELLRGRMGSVWETFYNDYIVYYWNWMVSWLWPNEGTVVGVTGTDAALIEKLVDQQAQALLQANI